MPWKRVPGFTGKVYVPENSHKGKKHPCKECFACQQCGQERCQVCRGGKDVRLSSLRSDKASIP